MAIGLSALVSGGGGCGSKVAAPDVAVAASTAVAVPDAGAVAAEAPDGGAGAAGTAVIAPGPDAAVAPGPDAAVAVAADSGASGARAADATVAAAPLSVRAPTSPLRLVQRWGRAYPYGGDPRASADGQIAALWVDEPPGLVFLDGRQGEVLGEATVVGADAEPGEPAGALAWALAPDGATVALVAPDRPGVWFAREGLATVAPLPPARAVVFTATRSLALLADGALSVVHEAGARGRIEAPELADAQALVSAGDALYVVWAGAVRAVDPATVTWSGPARSLAVGDATFAACAIRGHFAVGLDVDTLRLLDLRDGAVATRALGLRDEPPVGPCDLAPTHDGRGAVLLSSMAPGGTEWFELVLAAGPKATIPVSGEGVVLPVTWALSADDARAVIATARGAWVGTLASASARREVERMVDAPQTLVGPGAAWVAQARSDELRVVRLDGPPDDAVRTVPMPRDLSLPIIAASADGRWLLVSGVKWLGRGDEVRTAEPRFAWYDLARGALTPTLPLRYTFAGRPGGVVQARRGERNGFSVEHQPLVRDGVLGIVTSWQGPRGPRGDDAESEPRSVFVALAPGGKVVGEASLVEGDAADLAAADGPAGPLPCGRVSDALRLPAAGDLEVALPKGACDTFEWTVVPGSGKAWTFVLGRRAMSAERLLLVPLDAAARAAHPPAPVRLGPARVDGAFVRPDGRLVTWGPDAVAVWEIAAP